MGNVKYEDFELAVNCLIGLNKANRERVEIESLGLESWLREFATVHVNIGRQTGKTEYITKHATDNDIVLTFKAKVVQHLIENKTQGHIFSFDYFINNYFRVFSDKRVKVNNVYVDEPKHCCGGVSEFLRLYSVLDSKLFDIDKETTIIKLGE